MLIRVAHRHDPSASLYRMVFGPRDSDSSSARGAHPLVYLAPPPLASTFFGELTSRVDQVVADGEDGAVDEEVAGPGGVNGVGFVVQPGPVGAADGGGQRE